VTDGRWDFVVHDARGRRRRGSVSWRDSAPARFPAPTSPEEFSIVVLSEPAEVRGVPAATAVCVPGPTNVRSVGPRSEPDMPASIDELTLLPHRMAEFAAGSIVTTIPDLIEPDDVFPPHSERPRLDRLALALLRAADAEAMAPYLAIIRRELALRPGTDPLIALEARLSPADVRSRPPARAPGIQRLSKALRALREDRPPDCDLEVMAEDLHFLCLFEDGDKVLSRDALDRLLTDMMAEPERRRRPGRQERVDPDAPPNVVPFRPQPARPEPGEDA
jgi:hypothetical protein